MDKLKKIAVYASVFGALALMWTCGVYQNENANSQEASAPIQEEAATVYVELTAEERKTKLAECASCHPDEAHAEMIGPHSQSYVKLLEHMEMAADPKCFQRPYNAFLGKYAEFACPNCHASKNLFESALLGLDTMQDLSNITKVNYRDAWSSPPPRDGEENRMTGIDCLTCHLKGNAVITNEDFVRNPELEAPCNPQSSKFFSSNLNCASCHYVTNEGVADNINNPELTADMSCNGCHMEKDEDGEYTHYYYWRHDHESKAQHPLLSSIFEDVEIKRISSGRFAFDWKNRKAPHRFSECAESYAVLDFISSDGSVCFSKTQRLNNKGTHDEHLKPFFGDTVIWSEVGYTFLPDSNPETQILEVGKCEPMYIRVRGYEKPQYWMNDSCAQLIYDSKYPL